MDLLQVFDLMTRQKRETCGRVPQVKYLEVLNLLEMYYFTIGEESN